MANFFKEIKTVYKTVYEMKKWTKPKIYKGGRDGKGRWYIYFFYEHPTEKKADGTPVRKQINCPTLGLNQKFKDKKDRERQFKAYRDAVEATLEKGYSPFSNEPDQTTDGIMYYSAEKAIDYALNQKTHLVSKKTVDDYASRCNVFKQFLKKRGFLNSDVKLISRKLVIDFLNEIAKKTSASNRNNYRGALSAIFSVLENEEYVNKNYFATISNLKSKPKAHKIYSDKQIKEIFEYLEKEDTLRLYIELIAYNFLRPVEACRLQVKDLDLDNAILTVDSKTKNGKRKRIPSILVERLKGLDLSNPNAYLITNDGVAETKLSAEQRRETFSKRYTKVREELGYSKEYDVYSFRHYFITKLHNELHKQYTHTEAMDILQGITGHTTRTALEKYLRSIEAVIADDYSHLLKIKKSER